MELKLGSDPEFFLFDKKLNTHISGHNILWGSKEEPAQLKNGGGLQRDGLAGEFNIIPAKTESEFIENIESSVKEIEGYLAGINKNLEMSFLPLVKFDEEHFKRVPALWKVLGCEPDFIGENINHINQPSEDAADQPIRTAGGHIHLGWRDPSPVDDMHLANCVEVVRQVLYNITVPEGDPILEKGRRKVYGGGIAWRAKPYGLEFRSPSNHWVKDKNTMSEIYKSTHDVWDAFIANM